MDADAGVTVTEPTGTLVTVTAAVPLFPSLVAVIVAEPAATPVTNPLPLTVAAAGLLDAQVTTRPVSAAPLASFGVAVSCTVCPLCRFAVAGLTVTDATGTLVTVIAAVALLPSLVAVMVAEPAPAPVTNPLPLTVAAAGLLDAHVTTRPVSAAPLASCGVAVSCTVWPTCRLAVAGLTVTDATGTLVTVIAAVALLPSLVAVIVAEPAPAPVTNPLPVTVAAAGLLDAHVTTRPVSAAPLASFGVAVTCTVWPTCRLAVAGLTVTDARATADRVIAVVALWPSLVAVIVAAPTATPVTNPLALTVAAAGLLLAHVTTRPDSGVPFASCGVAVNCTVLPVTTVADPGLTDTDATGISAIVTDDVPFCPSLVAVIVAAPTATPVTTPLALTVAAAGLLDTHVTTRPDSGLPLASCGVAVSCTVCPTCRLAVAGLTVTDPTDTLDTVTTAGA